MGQWDQSLIIEWRKIRASSKALQEGCGKITSNLNELSKDNFTKINLNNIKKYTVPVEGKEHKFRDILEEYDLI